jgi:hypothetical protein
MGRVFFVTGSKGDVESLRRSGAVLKLNDGVGIVLNISLMLSRTTIPPRNDLQNVVSSDGSEVVPSLSRISVMGVLEKSQKAVAV